MTTTTNALTVRQTAPETAVRAVVVPDGPAPVWAGAERVPLTFPIKLPGGGAVNVKGRFEVSEPMESAVRARDHAKLMVALIDTVARTEEVTLSIVDSAAAAALSKASGLSLTAGKGKRPMSGKELAGWIKRLVLANSTDNDVRKALSASSDGPRLPSGRAPKARKARKARASATTEPSASTTTEPANV